MYDRPKIIGLYRTPTYVYEEVGFLAKSLTHSYYRNYNILSPFKYETWFCLVLTTLTIYILKNIIPQSFSLFSRIATKFVYMYWFVILLLIIELYGNLLVVNLILINQPNLVFKDLDDLGEKLLKHECRFVLYEMYMTAYENIFKEQNKSWTKAFLQSLHVHSVTVKDKSEITSIIKNSSSCLVGLDFVYHKTEFDMLM